MKPLLLSLIVFPFLLRGQFLENPSFEGPTGIGNVPPGWYACKDMSTPDTHGRSTFLWAINGSPSHGSTFLGLVTRGQLGHPSDGTTEAIGTSLRQPLQKGRCYRIMLSLSSARDMVYNDGRIFRFDQPVVLKIYGGTTQCAMKYLLSTSQAIQHGEWREYTFNFYIPSDILTLTFEVDYAGDGKTFGNVLLDNVRITETSSGIELGQDQTVCFGQKVTLTLPNANDEAEIYWSNGSSNNSIVVDQEGIYSVRVVHNNCVLTDSIRIKFIPRIIARETKVISFCEGESKQIGSAVQGAVYRWNTGQTSEIIDVDKTGTYIQTIGNGCEEVSNIFQVDVDNTCCTISAPNIFTPNGDDMNDRFQILVGNGIRVAVLQIVNRWGSKVYEAVDLYQYWDGMKGDIEASNGVYFWTIDFDCQINGQSIQKKYKGTITLKR